VDIETGDENGKAVSIKAVGEDDHLIAMSERGQIMRTRVAEISEQGRNTKGVIVMRLEDGDRVASVDVFPGADARDEEGGEDEGED
jgi:DNA gyrase subunit A